MISVSNKVYIKRKKAIAAYPGADKVDSKMKIGSSFKNQSVLRGLSHEEEMKFLPNVLGLSAKSDKWEKATQNYWANISKVVPQDNTGLELEIGFDYENKEAKEKGESVSVEERHQHGRPIRLNDYILYRYCLLYRRVANSIEDVNKSPHIWFYIHTKERQLNLEHTKAQSEDKALQEYFKILTNRDKVVDVLTVFAQESAKLDDGLVPFNLESLDDREQDLLLRKCATKYPKKFHDFATDTQLEMRSFIERSIVSGKLRRVPNTDTVIYGDNTTIGNTMDDCIAFLKNPKNAKVYNNLVAQMKYMATPKQEAKAEEEPATEAKEATATADE
jgi:hypothetical protein